jgi:peptidyl-tRNA hydrolase, PTH1 family
VWLEPFLDAVCDAAPLLASKDENAFGTKVALILGSAEKPKPASQSHIRQARPHKPDVKIPETGPMAAMLKRLFGKE